MSTTKFPPVTFFPLKTKLPSFKLTTPLCCPVTFFPNQLIELLAASTFLDCAETVTVAKATTNANAIVFKFFICF